MFSFAAAITITNELNRTILQAYQLNIRSSLSARGAHRADLHRSRAITYGSYLNFICIILINKRRIYMYIYISHVLGCLAEPFYATTQLALSQSQVSISHS